MVPPVQEQGRGKCEGDLLEVSNMIANATPNREDNNNTTADRTGVTANINVNAAAKSGGDEQSKAITMTSCANELEEENYIETHRSSYDDDDDDPPDDFEASDGFLHGVGKRCVPPPTTTGVPPAENRKDLKPPPPPQSMLSSSSSPDPGPQEDMNRDSDKQLLVGVPPAASRKHLKPPPPPPSYISSNCPPPPLLSRHGGRHMDIFSSIQAMPTMTAPTASSTVVGAIAVHGPARATVTTAREELEDAVSTTTRPTTTTTTAAHQDDDDDDDSAFTFGAGDESTSDLTLCTATCRTVLDLEYGSGLVAAELCDHKQADTLQEDVILLSLEEYGHFCGYPQWVVVGKACGKGYLICG